MSEHRIYRVTSIGRPIDPKYPTNKAIPLLMPVAALIAGVVTFMQGVGAGASVTGALEASLMVFGCWALGREMAPDDNSAAFVGAVLAFVALWWWPLPSLLLLVTALALSRIVNRSTGLTSRLGDSGIVTALVICSGKILSRRAGPPMPENHGSKGFMNFRAEILGLVFLGVTYSILVPVLIRRIDSGAIITVVCVLLFLPLFVASFWLADVLTGFDSGKEREEEEQRRQARHRDRRGRRKSL